MARLSTFSLTVVAALAAGCGYTNLEGDYDGEIDCGSDGAVGAEMEVTENGTAFYEGVLVTEPIAIQGVVTSFELTLDIEQTAARGGQVLNIDDAACIAVYENGDTSEVDCSDFDELGFDGEATISAEISDFLSVGLDCELLLER